MIRDEFIQLSNLMQSDEQMNRSKEEQIHKSLNLLNYILIPLALVDGLEHKFLLNKTDSPLRIMLYTFILMAITLSIKLLITYFKRFEKYAAFMITFATMIMATERSFYMEPEHFKLSSV